MVPYNIATTLPPAAFTVSRLRHDGWCLVFGHDLHGLGGVIGRDAVQHCKPPCRFFENGARIFILGRSGRGHPQKCLASSAQYPCANFVRNSSCSGCTADDISRTQFVVNFDQRSRNISLGRAFGKRDPQDIHLTPECALRRKRTFAGDQYWPLPNFRYAFCCSNLMWQWPQRRTRMKISVCLQRIFIGMALMAFWFVSTAHAEMASVYGGPDGYCGSRTANGERVDCSAMTAAHRRLPFGTRVRVCHSSCVTVRINDRGPWVRGRDIDLSPAAARAIGLDGTGHVTISQL